MHKLRELEFEFDDNLQKFDDLFEIIKKQSISYKYFSHWLWHNPDDPK